MLYFVRRDIFACAKVIFRLLRPWHSGILFAHTAAAGNITRRSRISQHRNNTRCMRIELKKALASASAFFLAVANRYDASCFLVYRTLLGLVLFVICLTSFGVIFLPAQK